MSRCDATGAKSKWSGQVLVEAQDGGLLLETPDGALWIIQPEELVRRHRRCGSVFQPWGPDEMARQLLVEFPSGFKIHRTANYVICYNTSDAYAAVVRQSVRATLSGLLRLLEESRSGRCGSRSFRWWRWCSTTRSRTPVTPKRSWAMPPAPSSATTTCRPIA